MAVNDIVAMCDSVVTLINKYTATLSSDLSLALTKARPGRPEHGIASNELPLVMVAMSNFSEDMNSLGTGAHRDNRMTIDLYPIIQTGIGFGGNTGQAEAEDEANRLTHNLVDLIRAKPDLSGTVSWVDGVDVEFNQEFGDEGTYVKCNRISIRAFKFIS